LTHLVINLVAAFHQPGGQQKAEEELVLLEQRAAHIPVDAESEMVLDALDSLLRNIVFQQTEIFHGAH